MFCKLRKFGRRMESTTIMARMIKASQTSCEPCAPRRTLCMDDLPELSLGNVMGHDLAGEAPLPHHQDAVAVVEHLRDLVGDHDDGQPPGGEVLDDLVNPVFSVQVDADGRA